MNHYFTDGEVARFAIAFVALCLVNIALVVVICKKAPQAEAPEPPLNAERVRVVYRVDLDGLIYQLRAMAMPDRLECLRELSEHFCFRCGAKCVVKPCGCLGQHHHPRRKGAHS